MRLLRLLQNLPGRIAIAAAPVLRFLAALFLLAAIVSLVADLSHAGASSTAARWQALSPASFAGAAATVTRHLGAFAWNPVMTSILALPAYLLFGLLALLLGIAGRRRRVVNVYVN